VFYFILVVCGDAFETADGNWFFVNATAAAGWFTRAITRTAKYAGKHVGVPVDHVGLCVSALGNEADVFGNWRMGRTCILAVDYLVEIFRISDVCGFH
jgi:hypothetical protein